MGDAYRATTPIVGLSGDSPGTGFHVTPIVPLAAPDVPLDSTVDVTIVVTRR